MIATLIDTRTWTIFGDGRTATLHRRRSYCASLPTPTRRARNAQRPRMPVSVMVARHSYRAVSIRSGATGRSRPGAAPILSWNETLGPLACHARRWNASDHLRTFPQRPRSVNRQAAFTRARSRPTMSGGLERRLLRAASAAVVDVHARLYRAYRENRSGMYGPGRVRRARRRRAGTLGEYRSEPTGTFACPSVSDLISLRRNSETGSYVVAMLRQNRAKKCQRVNGYPIRACMRSKLAGSQCHSSGRPSGPAPLVH